MQCSARRGVPQHHLDFQRFLFLSNLYMVQFQVKGLHLQLQPLLDVALLCWSIVAQSTCTQGLDWPSNTPFCTTLRSPKIHCLEPPS